MIEFSEIKGFKNGRWNSFEEVVCQLARRERMPRGAEFRRIEGSGGDGGVEAYWVKQDGAKVGYQAKYYLKSGGIDWTKIDESVAQALQTHAELVEYIIALPCDLTERSGVKRKGKTGWEHWGSHLKKWTAAARENGNNAIRFIPWTAFELNDKLTQPSASGLRLYWFGEREFNDEWFHSHLDLALSSLGDRFHPEDHVDVSVQKLFGTMTRNDQFLREMRKRFEVLNGKILPDNRLLGLKEKPEQPLIDDISEAHAKLMGISEVFNTRPQINWDGECWIELCNKLLHAIDKFEDWGRNYKDTLSKQGDQSESYSIRQVLRDLEDLYEAARVLKNQFSSEYFAAEKKQIAVVEGIAGSGKSHLFGNEAQKALASDHPVIFVLGQRINNDEPWSQIAKLLGLPSENSQSILGALDAAGEARNRRSLFLIDAINEGPGAKFWYNHIAAFIKEIRRFKFISCIISCRREYLVHAIPLETLGKMQVFTIQGFETPDEQLQAARIYLDRRGIARPSTPWLAPEFVNPLFLRSICTALESQGKAELPAGLTGTRAILSYYLDTIGQNMTVSSKGLSDLSYPTKRFMQNIANKMAEDRNDYVSMSEAAQIASASFQGLKTPDEQNWLDILLGNGVIRRDPNPDNTDHDPLLEKEDVIRFSFQRFQDALIAEALLSKVDTPDDLFGKTGAAAFILNKNTLSWEWAGVFEALSVQVPEKLNQELADLLPGEFDHWWRNWQVQEAFVESVKWRDRQFFTKRSLELLNSLKLAGPNIFDVILEISVSSDHPWNGVFLHKNLIRQKLAERDSNWTVWLNNQSDESDSPVGRLIDWCLAGQVEMCKRENQMLAGIILCWFFTSSNRAIRDKSTKALSSLLLARADIFPELFEMFKRNDDLYLLERLLAAGYGACCRDQTVARLTPYASIVFKHIFSSGEPPLNLLLRDYARGIVELCQIVGETPEGTDIEKCYPPYKTVKTRLQVSKEQLDKTAKKAGNDEIAKSCSSFIGDFGTYEVQHRVGKFLAIDLNKNVPLSERQKIRVFRDEVIGKSVERRLSFEELERISNPYTYGIMRFSLGDEHSPTEYELEKWQDDLSNAQEAFLSLLSDGENEKYEKEVVQALAWRTENKESSLPKFNFADAQRWVANRAYRYGWNVKLFPSDYGWSTRHTRDRPLVERIGKKYQWLALSELMCRLADNYWLEGDDYELPKLYDTPLDVGFERDIDPTILSDDQEPMLFSDEQNSWMASPQITLPNVSEEDLPCWPFLINPATNLKTLVYRTDMKGKKWIVLYEHQSVTDRYPKDETIDHGARQQEFRFLSCVFVRKSTVKNVVSKLHSKQEINLHDWGPSDFTDGPFLFEAPWRNTWNLRKWYDDAWYRQTGQEMAFPSFGYQWESHLDASLPNGFRTHIPSPWLAKDLTVSSDPALRGHWKTDNGKSVFLEAVGREGGVIHLAREDFIAPLLERDDLTCLWLLIAERNSWLGGHNDDAAWRRSEGACWLESGKLKTRIWKRDNANGHSRKILQELKREDSI